MEKNKNSIWKKIAAIVTSGLLIFSKTGMEAVSQQLEAPSNVTVNSELPEKDMKMFHKLGNHYKDFKAIAEYMISMEETYHTFVAGETCDTMVPQGLDFLDEYILITAYDGIEGYKGELALHSYDKKNRDKLESEKDHKPHNSVIFVYGKDSKSLITTIELPDINHVGGIAVDEKNVYIAKSLERNLSVINRNTLLEKIKNAERNENKETKINYSNTLDCDCDASFVTLRKQKEGKEQIVVGTWNPLPNSSTIRIFDIDKEGKLELSQKININSSANGAAFVEKDGQEYLLVACSLGRSLDSFLHFYEVNTNEDSKIELEGKGRLVLPPMIEEIVEFTGQDGKPKLAMGSEVFTKRYEIGRHKIYPTGIIIADLESVLNREKQKGNKPKKIEETVFQDILKEDEIVIKPEDEEHDRD